MRESRREHYLAPAAGEDSEAVLEADARDQECSWAQIGDLLGVTRASAWQRYGGHTARDRTPLDPD
jgi:hypothetical protein